MKAVLSPREREVLDLAVSGHTDEAIAGSLGIEPGTVNSYWIRIRGKLGNYSRTELAARWVQAGADRATKIESDRRDAEAADLAAINKELLDSANSEIEVLEKARDAEKLRRDADDTANKNLLDKANLEIDRLKELLSKEREG